MFGIGKELDAAGWRALFRQLVAGGHLATDEEGHGTFQLAERARGLLKGEEKLLMRVERRGAGRKAKVKREAATAVAPVDAQLYAALKAVRLKLAGEARVPPFVICHDKTLVDMCHMRPRNEAELKLVNGIGEAKAQRYGRALLEVVARFPRTLDP